MSIILHSNHIEKRFEELQAIPSVLDTGRRANAATAESSSKYFNFMFRTEVKGISGDFLIFLILEVSIN